MTEEITWDQVYEEEEITEDDIKKAESSGRPPAGKFLCVVESTKPKQVNPEGKESYFKASLKMKIEEVVELNGKPVSGDEGDEYIGRYLYDDIALPRTDEPDALRNKRICVAKRGGIISENSSKIPGNTWSELIVGKRFLITNEDHEYTPKGKPVPVKTTQVAMFGYESPEAATKISDSDLADI